MSLFDRIFGGKKQKDAYPKELQTQIEMAMYALQALTAAHDGTWRLGEAAWNVDQDQGTITFEPPNGMRVTAPVQIIGSYDTQDGTWLWSWNNPSIKEPLTADARNVQSLGQEKGYEVLTTPKLTCSEEQCWELTALACMMAGAQGAYRGPAGSVRVFMTFGQITLSKAD